MEGEGKHVTDLGVEIEVAPIGSRWIVKQRKGPAFMAFRKFKELEEAAAYAKGIWESHAQMAARGVTI